MSRSLLALSLLVALCAGAAALGAPSELAAPMLLFGAALPVIVLWSPVEPSVLKLFLLATLISPPLCTALRFSLGSSTATLWVLAGLQLGCLAKTTRFDRPGRAGLFALGLSMLAGTGFAVFVAGSTWSLTGWDGPYWHGMVAQSLLSGAFENPFLAGTPIPTHPGYAALVATVADLMGTDVFRAQAWLGVWALTTIPMGVMLTAAPLWGEHRPVMLAPVFALLVGTAGVVPKLFDATPLGEVLLSIGPRGPAIALAVGAWLAASHGLRHGKRPWVGLIGLLGGASLCLSPAIGAAALLVPALAVLVAPGTDGLRLKTWTILIAWSLPGLWLARRFGVQPFPVEHSVDVRGMATWTPMLLLAVFAMEPILRGTDRPRRTLATLSLCAGLVPLAVVYVLPEPGLSRLAIIGLSALAAGGAFARPRVATAPLAALVLLVGAFDLVTVVPQQLEPWQQESIAVIEDGTPVLRSVEDPGSNGLLHPTILSTSGQVRRAQEARTRFRSLAYRWIRDNREALGEDAILWRSVSGIDDARARGPLALHLAPLFTGLPLWCDEHEGIALGGDRHEPRSQGAKGLFAGSRYDAHLLRELQALDRPAVFLVEEEDRENSIRGGEPGEPRGVDHAILRLGAEQVHRTGLVTIYLWRPTP